jgi:colanic acid biosynthesis glycosyl transferase WcaI
MARIGLAFEGPLYRRATRVVTISDGFTSPLRDLGVLAGAVRQIPDWVDTDALRPLPQSASMRAWLGARDGDFLVLHAGNMGEKQALQHVVHAAGALSTDSKVQIALVGQGPQSPRLESEIKRMNPVPIRILPLVPKEEVATMLSAADVLLVSQRTQVVDSVLPSKMLSYMASGRPIIAAAAESSATANLIRTADCGIVVAPEDARALAHGIETLQGDPAMCRRMGTNGRRHVIEKFSKAEVLKRWDSLLAEVVPKVDTEPLRPA